MYEKQCRKTQLPERPPLCPAGLHTLWAEASLELENWDVGGWPQDNLRHLSQGPAGGP